MSQRSKKDKPSQGLGKDGRGEGCRRKKTADRMLWGGTHSCRRFQTLQISFLITTGH